MLTRLVRLNAGLIMLAVVALHGPLVWKAAITIVEAAEVVIDGTIETISGHHVPGIRNVVFISDQTAYAFYVDSDGSCAYSKTTNGGTSWGTPVTFDSQTDCEHVAVWYDRWTPGLSSSYIHIGTFDTGADALWYTRLDTSSDTLTTPVNAVSNTGQGGTIQNQANINSIGVGTDGDIYMAMSDNSDAYVVKCTTTCTTATNWTEAGTNPMDLRADPTMLLPLPGGDMLLIRNDTSADKYDSIEYTDSTNTWAGSWTNIDAAAAENGSYRGAMAAFVDHATNDVYLAYGADIKALGTDDDIRTSIYDGSSWTAATDVLTNSTYGITGVALAKDTTTGEIYVGYSARTTASSANTANIYWKKSTDSMTSWGTQSSAINASADDIFGLNMNMMSNERIYVTWTEAGPDDLFGETVQDITVPAYTQAAYRWYANNNSADVGSTLAAQDTAATAPAQGTPFRLRLALHVASATLTASNENFKLQFATKSGSCDTGFSGETYSDVATGSGTIRYYNNSTPADGDNLTNNANDPSHSGHTQRDQDYEESNNFTNSVAAIAAGEDGLWDFSLVDNSASAGTSFCFRVVKSDGSALDTYSVVPEITTDVPVATLTQNAFRFYENVDAVQPTTALANENTVISNVKVNQVVRIRMSVQVATANLAAGQTYKLQYGQGSTCSAIGTWTDVGAAGSGAIWRGYDNATPSDGATVSANLLSVSDVSETYEEGNNSASSPNGINVGQDGEWDWVVQHNGATDTTDYCFRMVQSGGTVLDTYTNYPKLTTKTGALAITAPASASMGSVTFTHSSQTIADQALGDLNVVDDRGARPGWTLNVTGVDWVDGGDTMDYNGNGTSTGQLTIDMAGASITANEGSTSGITLGSTDSFDAGTSIIQVAIASSGNGTGDYDIPGIELGQFIPASQASSSYSMTLTFDLT